MNDPNKIEIDLMNIVPRNNWERITDLLIFHGRKICDCKKTQMRSLRPKQDLPVRIHF